jgi:FAD synthetase
VQVSIVPDQVAAIAAEVAALSAAHDVVITTGGVGPTLDDVTMQGVSDALGHHLTRRAAHLQGAATA